MANQEEHKDQKSRSAAAAAAASKGGENETGDPGRTPGTAEGDEQTIDEDLQRKENQGQI
ncbi:MAG TPA: hypothetical protein VM911_07320 [Pyrinomonadaceae bacterium]|nr:hypothetical protein [Pyrinomonadaceae bacterium]